MPVAMPAVMSVTMAIGAYALSQAEGDPVAAVGDRGTGRRRRAVQRQDRHADHEPAHASTRRSRSAMPSPRTCCSPRRWRRQTQQRGPDRPGGAARAQGPVGARAASSRPQFVPFDPVNKRTVATVIDAQGRTIHYAKGAPQVIAGAVQARSGDARANITARSADLAVARLSRARRRAARTTARPGSWSASSRCRTRRGRTPRPPSPRPRSSASTSRW